MSKICEMVKLSFFPFIYNKFHNNNSMFFMYKTQLNNRRTIINKHAPFEKKY